MSASDLKERVRRRYGAAALRVASGEPGGCGCGCSPGGVGAGGGGCQGATRADAPITSGLYAPDETAGLPAEAVVASLGCGNPLALARLQPGERVLDLGSGGGLDVLMAARRVGPTGKVYGLDMTDEMLDLARANQRKADADNVEFLKGEMESIPLPDSSVDVVMSNCVINLSADKGRVLAEAFRVLKPGGRLAVSDIVVRGKLSPAVRRNAELWAGCIAGALAEEEYVELLESAGFRQVGIERVRVYGGEDGMTLMRAVSAAFGEGAPGRRLALWLAFLRRPGHAWGAWRAWRAFARGQLMSAFVRGIKPAVL
ncbi:MAG: arsenite methyltransferase [Gemmatimonadetes bacterium]|nr:arsenite methyltransferase [Gemmatimonadota bacterium]